MQNVLVHVGALVNLPTQNRTFRIPDHHCDFACSPIFWPVTMVNWDVFNDFYTIFDGFGGQLF